MSIPQIILMIAHIIINMTQPIVNVEHLLIGVRERVLSITQPIMAVSHIIMSIAKQSLRQQYRKFTEQIVDSKQQILTMTAYSDQHRPNNKRFLGIWHSISLS